MDLYIKRNSTYEILTNILEKTCNKYTRYMIQFKTYINK